VKHYRLRISKLAVADIRQVLVWTHGLFGMRKHLEYKELIRQALHEIATSPTDWPEKHRPEIDPDAWTFHIARRGKRARHFFLYRTVEENFVDIGRFLHDSMELRRHLP
jgi:toxin ParE1/3/4